MCTSIVSNRKKTIVGWNLDLKDMEHRVSVTDGGVFIETYDATEGWMPLFGANTRGDFVGMPTCWPFDPRSNPTGEDGSNVILLDIDLLLQKKTLAEVKAAAESGPVFSVPGLTFMSALSDRDGNVLHIIPGQGIRYYEKPVYSVLTNFSPFKMDAEQHLWMGWDRYHTAKDMLEKASATQQKWKEFECGRLSWQATVNYLVMTAPQIKDLLYTGQKFDVVIKNVDDDTNTLSGTVWMKSVKQTATVGNICQGVFTLQGTGALV